MSGHSKWATIKHSKGVADAKRGQLFTKLTREIIVAVREGGSNSEANFRLRLAIQKARDSNMPYDNIDRAIKRGSGEGGGAALAEMILEGYGPGGAAILVQATSDNRNRTIQDVRNMFTRAGGSLAESGSVAWLFESKGVITVETSSRDPDELSLQAIDAGADDVSVGDSYIEIYTKVGDLEKVRTALEAQKIAVQSAEIVSTPKTTVELEDKHAFQLLKLLNRLEEMDETSAVFSNANFSDETLKQFAEQSG